MANKKWREESEYFIKAGTTDLCGIEANMAIGNNLPSWHIWAEKRTAPGDTSSSVLPPTFWERGEGDLGFRDFEVDVWVEGGGGAEAEELFDVDLELLDALGCLALRMAAILFFIASNADAILKIAKLQRTNKNCKRAT